MKTEAITAETEGVVIHPPTGELVAIPADAEHLTGVSASTISRLSAWGKLRRWGRYVSLRDLQALKKSIKVGRPSTWEVAQRALAEASTEGREI